MQLNYCIKMCYITFLIQSLTCYFFAQEYLDFKRSEPFYPIYTGLRLIISVLMHQACYQRFQAGVKMLTFLKRMQTAADCRKGRFINLLICSMHILTPVLANYSIMITLGQQSDLRQVVKTYVMLGFIMNVDVLVAKDLPDDVIKNAEAINALGGLRISKDYNLYSLIFGRMVENPSMLLQEIPNLLANVWFGVLINFQVILYNYFAPLYVVIIQLVGYWINHKTS